MATVTYKTDDLIGGEIRTDQGNLNADTYYRGMPLTYDAANDYYKYSAVGSEIGAIFMEDETRTLSTAGRGSIIVGGEIQEGGIVDDSGTALSIDDDYIAAAQLNGFYIKRK